MRAARVGSSPQSRRGDGREMAGRHVWERSLLRASLRGSTILLPEAAAALQGGVPAAAGDGTQARERCSSKGKELRRQAGRTLSRLGWAWNALQRFEPATLFIYAKRQKVLFIALKTMTMHVRNQDPVPVLDPVPGPSPEEGRIQWGRKEWPW